MKRLPIIMIGKQLRFGINDALDIYNKYRRPEANARLLRISRDRKRFIISFTGQFCRTCGVHDYFEDLLYNLLDEAKIRAKITDIKQETQTHVYKVTYEIDE